VDERNSKKREFYAIHMIGMGDPALQTGCILTSYLYLFCCNYNSTVCNSSICDFTPSMNYFAQFLKAEPPGSLKPAPDLVAEFNHAWKIIIVR
jgi:hypothetical protein